MNNVFEKLENLATMSPTTKQHELELNIKYSLQRETYTF